MKGWEGKGREEKERDLFVVIVVVYFRVRFWNETKERGKKMREPFKLKIRVFDVCF